MRKNLICKACPVLDPWLKYVDTVRLRTVYLFVYVSARLLIVWMYNIFIALDVINELYYKVS